MGRTLQLTLGFLISRSVLWRFGYYHPFLSRSKRLPLLMVVGGFGASLSLFKIDLRRSDLMDYYQKRINFDIDYQKFQSRMDEMAKLNYTRN